MKRRVKPGWAGPLWILVVLAIATPASATFSGQNGHILYGGDWIGRVWLENCKQWNPNWLGAFEPSYSPNGERVAFIGHTAEGRGSNGLWMARANATKFHLIKANLPDRRFESVSWSPDGRRLVAEASGDLYILRPDGSRLRKITDTAAKERTPRWAPNGRYIIYNRASREKKARLWTIRPSGRRAKQFSDHKIAEPVDFFPNGKRIIFVWPYGVYSMTVARPHRIRLVERSDQGYAELRRPVVSPDGRYWAVSHEGSGMGYISTQKFGDRDHSEYRSYCSTYRRYGNAVAWQPR